MSFAVNHLVGFGARRSSIATQTVTWNSADKSTNITLSNGDMDAERAAGSGWGNVRVMLGRSTGLFYWEMNTITASSANIIAGYMTSGASLDGVAVGQSADGAGMRRLGKIVTTWTHANTTAPGGTDTNGDRHMFAANMDNGKVRLVVDAASMLYLPSGFSPWNLA